MKYIFFNDVKEVKRFFKFFSIYLLFLLLILLFFTGGDQSNIYKLSSMGFKFNQKGESILVFLMYMLEILLISYLVINIYLKDIKFNSENIFLRMSPNKWLSCKLISIFFIIIVFIFIKFIIIFIFLIYRNISIDSILLISNMGKNILYILNIVLLCISILSCLSNKKNIFILLTLLIAYSFSIYHYTILEIPLLLLITAFLVLLVLVNIVFKREYISIFEYYRGA